MTSDNTEYPDMSWKSGWNPYEPFYPKDDFSKGLLSSIVKKTSKWLENLNQETSGEFGELGWNYTPDGGTIVFANESKDRFIQIWWDVVVAFTQEDVGTISICGSDKRFEDITNNLDFFTAVEQSIYNELEILQQAVASKITRDTNSTVTAPEGATSVTIEVFGGGGSKSAFDLDLEAAQRNGKSV
jgi:hypothetical protein